MSREAGAQAGAVVIYRKPFGRTRAPSVASMERRASTTKRPSRKFFWSRSDKERDDKSIDPTTPMADRTFRDHGGRQHEPPPSAYQSRLDPKNSHNAMPEEMLQSVRRQHSLPAGMIVDSKLHGIPHVAAQRIDDPSTGINNGSAKPDLDEELESLQRQCSSLTKDRAVLQSDLDAETKKSRDLQLERDEAIVALENEQKRQADVSMERQLRAHCKELEAQLQQANGDLQALAEIRGQNYDMEQRLQQQANMLEAKDKEMAWAHTHIKSQEESLKTAQTDNTDLREKFYQVSEELTNLRLSSRSLLDDEFFIEKWKTLHSTISSWSYEYFGGKLKRSWTQNPQDEPHVDILLLQMSGEGEIDALLRSEQTRPLVAQAYIWSFLQHCVFDSFAPVYSKGMHWALSSRADLIRLEKRIRPSEY